MEHFEMVEKLRERANVSYEEAKVALEETNWDILDAMILLEKKGQTRAPERSASQDTLVYRELESKKEEGRQERNSGNSNSKGSSFGENLKKFGAWCVKWIEKGNTNDFCVTKEGDRKFSVPITLLVVLLIFAFWVVLPLMIVSLFFGFRYHFEGPDMKNASADINRAMDNVANAAEDIKNDFTNNMNKQ